MDVAFSFEHEILTFGHTHTTLVLRETTQIILQFLHCVILCASVILSRNPLYFEVEISTSKTCFISQIL